MPEGVLQLAGENGMRVEKCPPAEVWPRWGWGGKGVGGEGVLLAVGCDRSETKLRNHSSSLLLATVPVNHIKKVGHPVPQLCTRGGLL